jgi:hypothetical protein
MIELLKQLSAIINKLIPSRQERLMKRMLKDDQELAEAIQKGDMKKVEQIRQKKQKYASLISVLVVFLMIGCKHTQPTPPIVGDLVPVRLQIGSPVIYENGATNIVQSNKNTLVSDAYIYESVTSQDNIKKK